MANHVRGVGSEQVITDTWLVRRHHDEVGADADPAIFAAAFAAQLDLDQVRVVGFAAGRRAHHLEAAVAGDRLLIHAVRDEDPEALRSMAAEGLIPGARIVVEAAADGSIEFDVTNDGLGARAVPTDIAQDVFVVPDPS